MRLDDSVYIQTTSMRYASPYADTCIRSCLDTNIHHSPTPSLNTCLIILSSSGGERSDMLAGKLTSFQSNRSWSDETRMFSARCTKVKERRDRYPSYVRASSKLIQRCGLDQASYRECEKGFCCLQLPTFSSQTVS